MRVDTFRQKECDGPLLLLKANQLFKNTASPWCDLIWSVWLISVYIVFQNWERCEAGLADSALQVKDLKTRLNQSMPEFEDELLSAEKYNKVHLQTQIWIVVFTGRVLLIWNIQWRDRASPQVAVISLDELNLSGRSLRLIFWLSDIIRNPNKSLIIHLFIYILSRSHSVTSNEVVLSLPMLI